MTSAGSTPPPSPSPTAENAGNGKSASSAAPSDRTLPRRSLSRHPWFVPLACVAAVVVFAVSVGLLYMQWVTTEPPVATVAVIGSDDTADATATLAGPTLDKPLTAALADTPDHQVSFHVVPGTYRLVVRQHDGAIWSHEVVARPDRACIAVINRPPTSRPARPATAASSVRQSAPH